MDFKALSLAILDELTDTNADKEYIAAKLRACIENDETDLYNVMDTKNKALQEKQLEDSICIKQLTEENEQLRLKQLPTDDPMIPTMSEQILHLQQTNTQLLSQLQSKDDQLTQAQSTITQMNTYIQSCQQEITRLRGCTNTL